MKFIFIIPALFLFASCSNKNQTNLSRPDLKDTLMEVDRNFSKLSESKNAPDAFLGYGADNLILMRKEQFPIVSLDTLKKFYEKRERKGYILTWEPLKADACGDLGYTFGSWKLKAKTDKGEDTTVYGIYTTIWKRQHDGSWKFVVDGGDETPSQFEFKK